MFLFHTVASFVAEMTSGLGIIRTLAQKDTSALMPTGPLRAGPPSPFPLCHCSGATARLQIMRACVLAILGSDACPKNLGPMYKEQTAEF